MAKAKMGRPTLFSDDVADEICDKLSQGISLSKICSNSEHLPTSRTVWRWIRENEDFCRKYELAKEESADHLAEEAIEIADATYTDATEIQQARLRIDTRKWYASKAKPKKYGDRQVIAGDEDAPLFKDGISVQINLTGDK